MVDASGAEASGPSDGAGATPGAAPPPGTVEAMPEPGTVEKVAMPEPGRAPPRKRRPGVQVVRTPQDLANIEFYDDVAEIEVPIACLDMLPLKNEDRTEGDRLRRVENAIRHHGYNNLEPVVVRLGRRGRWVIVNGGHRITAARHVSREFWSNLFGRKVRSIYFLLYKTPLSRTLIDTPEGAPPESTG